MLKAYHCLWLLLKFMLEFMALFSVSLWIGRLGWGFEILFIDSKSSPYLSSLPFNRYHETSTWM